MAITSTMEVVVRAAFLFPAVAVVAACGFKGDYGGTTYQCGQGERCPSGYTCVESFCRLPDANPNAIDSSIDSAPSPDAAPTGTRCGSISLLRDDFEDGYVDDAWWNTFSDPGATVTETGGRLLVHLDAGSQDVYAGVGSDYYYDLRGGQLQARVDAVAGADTILELRDSLQQRAQLVVEGGDLLATVFGTPSPGTRASVPYSPSLHRYWRLRGDDTDLFWETSPDGGAWTTLWSEPSPLVQGWVAGYVSAGGQLATPGTAEYDDVNPATPETGFCPAGDFTEGFGDGSTWPEWSTWTDTDCTLAETGGALQMTFVGAGNCFAGANTNQVWDLTESAFVIDAGGVPVPANFVTYVNVFNPSVANSKLEIGVDQSTYVSQIAGGTTTDNASFPYDPVANRYWRLRGHSSRLYIDTSPDKVSWTNRLDGAAQFDVSAVVLEFGAGNYDPVGGAVTVTLDSVNL